MSDPLHTPSLANDEVGSVSEQAAVSASAVVNVFEKVFTQNRLYRKRIMRALNRAPGKYSVRLVPGNVYLFWGYRTLHGNVRCTPNTVRAYLSVFASAFGLNIVAGDQYIALVLPSRIFRVEFEKRGLAPQNLSRLAADSGTVTSPLVPWNSCGAFMAAVLGVATLAYLPFALFNIASPLLSVVYGYTGFKIIKVPSTEKTGDDR